MPSSKKTTRSSRKKGTVGATKSEPRLSNGTAPSPPNKCPGLACADKFNTKHPIDASTIKGIDDAGNFYNCHGDLTKTQLLCREEYYQANDKWWLDGGYGGRTDDEAMIGDGGGLDDGAEGLAFLDRLLARQKLDATYNSSLRNSSKRRGSVAVDLGAGVGRITKLVLLKRFDEIRLVEANEGLSKRSKVYLGRKRVSRCIFTNCHLQDISADDVIEWGQPADLMWIQWTLQYLTDDDAIDCLRTLAGGLQPDVGVLVVKENRPFGNAREDRFQMDTPGGGNNRYDITRPDVHHRLLFQRAGLRVDFVEKGVETNTYALLNESLKY